MGNRADHPDDSLPLSRLRHVDKVCGQFEADWKAGKRPKVEDFLGDAAGLERSTLERELRAIEAELAALSRDDAIPIQDDPTEVPFAGPQQRPASGPHAASADRPERIGRYRILKTLGKGGFGTVYLARDEELKRPVAVKVPHPRCIGGPRDAEMYIIEAQVVAGLDHPGIVPVYDVGRTEDGLCYVVSKFIEGSSLQESIEQARPAHVESAALVVAVAEALHHAHLKGVVHRDIKPGNILLDCGGRPYLADFGLALKEADFGTGPACAGTLPYMSPEQARGEGHRVDGRSDLFGLGVVFYELLTGRRPFQAETQAAILEQITSLDPRPPRQVDDTIPQELERICLKALSKRAVDRYTTGRDLADDLRHSLGALGAAGAAGRHGHLASPEMGTPLPAVDTIAGAAGAPMTALRALRQVKVIPKGLRSFDAHDADFFLELLPGPRDRDGLPESVRFWKIRIEETDPDRAFAVGLIYGPSGCGKSSLVKAGLLPRLAGHVLAVYVEATAAETEARLLRGLRRLCPDLPGAAGLPETVAAIRRGEGAAADRKFLIVLDQFEQWLHAGTAEPNAPLVQALRQCDGGRIQCVVMVRDDFWMAATRFMAELEIDLLQSHNTAPVDLFDLRHTKKVLRAFGQAFGALPEDPRRLSSQQKEFLEQAASGLAREGKVVCVRLAVFAEMMKGRPWTRAALKEVGGTEGIGVSFLEEVFSAPGANPKHRLHQQAARSVLRALLPEQGSDIRGHMRSYRELLEVSGCAGRPKDFEQLLQILDAELRIVTPTDPEGSDSAERRQTGTEAKHYQLTHDYLVPALRLWLTRKQRETRRGRAELRLAERSSQWNARPVSRYLPSAWEWLTIRAFTRRQDHGESQRKMLRAAGRYYVVRGCVVLVVIALLTITGVSIRSRILQQQNAVRAEGLVSGLLNADIAQVPGIIVKIDDYRPWADRLLQKVVEEAPPGSRRKLYASLALLPVDRGQADYLYEQLLEVEPDQFPVVRDALLDHKEPLVERLWAVAEGTEQAGGRRFHAACALAAYDPADGEEDRVRWREISRMVANRLVAKIAQNPSLYAPAVEALRPARRELIGPLSAIFRDADRSGAERALAASVLATYAAEDAGVLADLLADADQNQFPVLLRASASHGNRTMVRLTEELDRSTAGDAPEAEKERLASRQANAAVALLEMGHAERVWALLKHGPDPRVRSYLIHRLGPLGADPQAVVKRLDEEKEVSVRRALILCLGEFDTDGLSSDQRESWADTLLRWYRDDPDAGIHGAAEWLLRRWNQEGKLHQADEELATGGPEGQRQWYVTGQGHTMVVTAGPVELLMGSPADEKDRHRDEKQHRRRIGRSFAVASKETTVRQFQRFLGDKPAIQHSYTPKFSPAPDGPQIGVLWYEAAAYCNWLSSQEGIPEQQWCYLPNESGKFAEGMKLATDYLARTGYRLPTEAEWEYACRAGTQTSRCYGQSQELLGKYAWYLGNHRDRAWPAATLKPNDLGLFDVHGNVWEWCQERFRDYPSGETGAVADDAEDTQSVVPDSDFRVVRGGSFEAPPWQVRSAYRNSDPPYYRLTSTGFRVARTHP